MTSKKVSELKRGDVIITHDDAQVVLNLIGSGVKGKIKVHAWSYARNGEWYTDAPMDLHVTLEE